MSAARPLRAVVFDAYGTLLDVHAAVGRHAGRLGERGPAISALWRAKQLEWSWILSATGDYEPFWELTGRALDHALAVHGVQDAPLRAELLDAYRELGAYHDAVSTLTALRNAGLATAILSNGSPDMLDAAVRAGGLAPLLDAVLSVDAVRCFKPDRRVYALATTHFGCAPGDLAFVSSNAWDAHGAQRFGFRVHWIQRGAAPAEYGLEATATVLPGLTALVAQLV